MNQRRKAINDAKEEAKQREREAQGPSELAGPVLGQLEMVQAASENSIPEAPANNNNGGGNIAAMTEDEMIQAAINASL